MKSKYLGTWGYSFKLRQPHLGQRIDEVKKEFVEDMRIYLEEELMTDFPFLRCVIAMEQLEKQVGDIDQFTQLPNKASLSRIVDFEYTGMAKRQITNEDQLQATPLVGRSKHNIRAPDKFSMQTKAIFPRNLTRRANDEVIAFRDAAPGLPILSEPRDLSLAGDDKIYSTYFHYKNPGEGVIVYIFDLDCDIDHWASYPEFDEITFQSWIPGGDFPLEPFTGDHMVHGSMMLAKIAGRSTGIAQKAIINLVTAADATGASGTFTIIDALLKMYDHIRTYNPHKPCIINMSMDLDYVISVEATGVTIGKSDIKDLLMEILKLDNIILVSAAGNAKPGVPITKYPSFLATQAGAYKRRHVVVGATDDVGFNQYQYDEDMPYFVWAPTWDVEHMWTRDDGSLKFVVGDGGATSLAAATVSGMLAMYISRNLGSKTRLDDAIRDLKDLAWQRNPRAVPLIHNGITPAQWPAEFRKISLSFTVTSTDARTRTTRVTSRMTHPTRVTTTIMETNPTTTRTRSTTTRITIDRDIARPTSTTTMRIVARASRTRTAFTVTTASRQTILKRRPVATPELLIGGYKESES
ncbi:hypothetical protein TWF281_000228 [Arthrobotrys megalospora]